MPVRIVKDNPNEQSLGNALNNTRQGGGNIDFSAIGSILNQLGGGQQGGGGLGKLLGGNNSAQVGSLINSVLGGGGGRSSQPVKGGSGGNALLQSLASMAINACLQFAMNRLTQGGGNLRASATAVPASGKPVAGRPVNTGTDAAEALLQQRMRSAEICVSLWSYTCGADSQLQEQEKEAIFSLIDSTVNELFPPDIAEQSEVRQELLQIFSKPWPYDKMVSAASADPKFATDLFGQACFLVAADRRVERTEDEFLKRLVKDLKIPQAEADNLRRQFKI
jgi:uncharacterized membrane protein YebE (DUF533 family)